MQAADPSQGADFFAVAGDLRASGARKSTILLEGMPRTPGNYRLNYSSGGNAEEWKTPRHRHNFEQIRLPLNTDLTIGHRKVVPAGWISYFPESVYYGPQVRPPNLQLILIQFGGPSGFGLDTAVELRSGMDALTAAGGAFKGGMYSWVDDAGSRHTKDASEAVYEQNRGEPIVYPEPRLADIVTLNPAAYPWGNMPGVRGVRRRAIAEFTERSVRLGMLSLETGAFVGFGSEPAPEIAVVLSGAIDYDGKTYGQYSAFGTTAEQDTERLTASEPAELLYVKLPTFAPGTPVTRAPAATARDALA